MEKEKIKEEYSLTRFVKLVILDEFYQSYKDFVSEISLHIVRRG